MVTPQPPTILLPSICTACSGPMNVSPTKVLSPFDDDIGEVKVMKNVLEDTKCHDIGQIVDLRGRWWKRTEQAEFFLEKHRD
jgi:hypothetical protein